MPTANLGLPYVVSGQNQPEITIASAFDILDSLVTKKTGDTLSGPLGINTTSGPGLQLQLTDAGGGSDVPALRPTFLELYHITSATTVAGVGHGVNFTTKDAAGTKVSIGRLLYEITTPTAGSVESTGTASVFSNNIEIEPFRWIGSAASPGARPATLNAGGAMPTGVPGYVGGKVLVWGTLHNVWNTRMHRDAATGTVDPLLWIKPGLDTALTASTEQNTVLIDCSASRQWNAGNFTNQREVLINAPTYTATGATVITNAATMHVFGQPTAGANVSITNPAALWVQGAMNFGTMNTGVSKAGQTACPGRNATFLNTWWTQPVNSGTFPASTETYLSFWDPSNGTMTWATGNMTNQRENFFKAPTYAAAGASTFTNAATVAIENAPQTTGGNLTLTNPFAFWVMAGKSQFDGNVRVQGLAPAIRTITGNTTLTAADHTIFADATGGNITITVPLAASFPGQEFIAKKIDVSANTVTLARSGGDSIEGATSFVISGALAVARIKSNSSTAWWSW